MAAEEATQGESMPAPPDHEENKAQVDKRRELLERAAAAAAQLLKEVSAPNKSD